MEKLILPIDGGYFATSYFWITSAIAVVVCFFGAFMGEQQ